MAGTPQRTEGVLVVGGQSHDLDFVRLELLNELARRPELRVQVDSDFELGKALDRAAFVIAYTCNVEVSTQAGDALQSFVARGGRLLALHATNSLLDWTPAGVASRHRRDAFFETLGSAFVAHPPIGSYEVTAPDPEHPLVRGLTPFTVEDDELYLSEFFGEVQTLLETRFSGDAPGFTAGDWRHDNPVRPVMYLHRVGAGEVLYLTPGHARGHWDAPHRTPYYPNVERGAWACPTFRELLRRSIAWAARRDHEVDTA